jgi:hypothetical protein
MTSILSGTEFNCNTDVTYTKVKVTANGRRQIGILNNNSKKSFYLSTPLMLTWGVNSYEDDKTGEVSSYDMALQFPNDEYNNPECVEFLKNMQAFEQKLKADVITNAKEWLNKTKMSPDAVEALWTPMLKYPKDKDTKEPDYSRPPTIKVKIPYWEGEFKNVELYNDKGDLVFPVPNGDGSEVIGDFIAKGSNIATLIQCGGVWVANGKFGVTWRLFQGVVKPRLNMRGKCHIVLTDKDKEKMNVEVDEVDNDDPCVVDSSEVVEKIEATHVQDSDEEDEVVVPDTSQMVMSSVKDEVKEEVESKTVAVEDAPKKKKVVKKKPVADAP